MAVGYDAFISYSHEHDGSFAPALQTALERFAKPWYRMRAVRVFRDDADLAANPGLWRSIEGALSSSAWFVLLASAQAAQSSWVEREVAWWLTHRGPERMLIAATSPGLAWDEERDDWGPSAPVPPSLRGVLAEQPRSVDLTPIHDAGRWRTIPDDYLADLAAPMRGVLKSELMNEHLRQHRRTRRHAGAAITALAGLLTVVAVLLVFGLSQRQAASLSQRITVSDQLATDSEDIATSNPGLAAMLAAAAWRIAPTPLARESMLNVLADPERIQLGPGDQDVAFSPDGKILATASHSGIVQLWNVRTHLQIGEPIDVGSSLVAVAFSPDGKILATAGKDIRLWSVATSHLIASPIAWRGRFDPAVKLAFSPSGKMIAALTFRGSVLLWNMDTHQQIGASIHLNGRQDLTALAFSPDGKLLAAGGTDGTVRLWNVATQHQIGAPVQACRCGFSFHGEPAGGVDDISFSPDGSILATASANEVVGLRSVHTRRLLRATTVTRATGGAYMIAFSPDGKLLAVVGGDGQARVLDARSLQQLGMPLPARHDTVSGLAFSSDGTTLATGHLSGEVQLWDVGVYRQFGRAMAASMAGESNGQLSVALSPDGNILATASGDHAVRLWSTATQTQIGAAMVAAGSLNGVAFSPDGKIVATASGNGAQFWSVATHREIGTPMAPGEQSVIEVAFDPSGKIFVTLSGDGTARLWAVTAPHRQIGTPISAGYSDWVNGISFSPDGKIMATGSTDSAVRLWDIATHRQIGSPIKAPAGLAGVLYSPDGRILATAGDDGSVRLWNATTRQQIGAPVSVPGGLFVMAFSPDSTILATGSDDGNIRLWDVATQRQIGRAVSTTASGLVGSVIFGPKGAMLAGGWADGRAILADVQFPRNLLAATCSIAGRPLTRAEWNTYISLLPYRKVC